MSANRYRQLLIGVAAFVGLAGSIVGLALTGYHRTEDGGWHIAKPYVGLGYGIAGGAVALAILIVLIALAPRPTDEKTSGINVANGERGN